MKILVERNDIYKLPDVRMAIDIEGSNITICLSRYNIDGSVKVIDLYKCDTEET